MKILRNLFLFTFIYVFSYTCEAQKFQLSVTGGVLTSQVDGDNLYGYHKLGLTFGLNLNYIINERNHVAVSLDYLNIGSSYYKETKPRIDRTNNITLLSLDMHTASYFLGYAVNFNEVDLSLYRYHIEFGVRILKTFKLNTERHSIFNQNFEFDDQFINTTIWGPEIKFGIHLTDKISINIVGMRAFNNLVLTQQFNIEKLLPFHFGVTTSYILNYKKKKKRRKY